MKKHFVIKLILISIISGAATFSYLVYTYNLIKEEDLVRTSLNRTSWLQPKQWRKYKQESNGETVQVIYGDGLQKDNKSSAVLLVSQTNQQRLLTNALPEYYENIRESLLKTFDPNQIRSILTSADNIGCLQTPNVNKSADRSNTGNITGLILITASCSTKYSSFNIKARFVAGKEDGIVRLIFLASEETARKKNEAVFNKMLDSISASGSYAMKTTIAQN